MRSFVDLDRTFGSQPRELGAELARIDIGKGQERLFADQVPQLLRSALRERPYRVDHRLERDRERHGPAKDRAERIAGGQPAVSRPATRRSSPVIGTRSTAIMRLEQYQPLTVAFRAAPPSAAASTTPAGAEDTSRRDQNLIVVLRERGGARSCSSHRDGAGHDAAPVPSYSIRYKRAPSTEGRTHPLVLDRRARSWTSSRSIPVADGNGRLARLLTTYELLATGYGVARYVSLEQRIFEAKNTYYQTASTSRSVDWHDGCARRSGRGPRSSITGRGDGALSTTSSSVLAAAAYRHRAQSRTASATTCSPRRRPSSVRRDIETRAPRT